MMFYKKHAFFMTLYFTTYRKTATDELSETAKWKYTGNHT